MSAKDWRTPGLMLLCGGIILTLSLGARAGFGLFLKPMTVDLGWSREAFSFAFALQNLVWGAAQPFLGMIADRKGAGRVLAAGAALWIIGLLLTAVSTTGMEFSIAMGLLVGLAQGCTGFSIVFGVLARVYPAERRTLVLGIASAAGSFGQFAFLPYTHVLIENLGWFNAYLVLAATTLLIIPLSTVMVEKRPAGRRSGLAQSVREAVSEAFAHRGFLMLTAGNFVCGFQLMFITVHFPAYVADRGFGANVGMVALALVGLFNIVGSFGAGALGVRFPKKFVLSFIYFVRSAVIALFVFTPMTETSIYLFASVIGVLWLATVPLTNGVVGQIFGPAYLSTLSGFVFFNHQIGSFVGVWLAGHLFDSTGSYNLIWIISIALGIFAGLVNLPIDERPIRRAPALNPAA